MLPVDITTQRTREQHINDHVRVHRRLNTIVYADDYASLAAAVDAASAAGVAEVRLNPASTYTLTDTLIIPPETRLNGGGLGYTSLGAGAVRHRAHLVAGAALDPMIRLSNTASLTGCWVDGNSRAVGAIYAKDTVNNVISDNFIDDFTAYGIRLGGCLFTTLKRNYTYAVDGYGLDALQAYGDTGYYGVNVCLSERNEWQGARGAMRVEGILTSLSDDFESGAAAFDTACITVGGTVQSQVVMIAPYIELHRTTYTNVLRAIHVGPDSDFALYGGQAFSTLADTNDVFVETDRAAALHVTGSKLARWSSVFSGTLRPTATVVLHNRYQDCAVLNGFDDLSSAAAVLAIWPGQQIGADFVG